MPIRAGWRARVLCLSAAPPPAARRLLACARVYILVLALFLVSAIAYNPLDTLVGVAMTATSVPVYMWIRTAGRA
jgi:hypothetical protein